MQQKFCDGSFMSLRCFLTCRVQYFSLANSTYKYLVLSSPKLSMATFPESDAAKI